MATAQPAYSSVELATPAAEEATYLRAVTDFPFKITLPAPSYYFADLVSIDGSDYSGKLELVAEPSAFAVARWSTAS